MKRILLFLTGLLILFSSSSHAQFVLSAELRPRFEYRDGYRTLAIDETDPLFIISQRTRLKATYTHKVFGACISIQDVRVWGDDDYYSATTTGGNSGSIILSEGWLELYVTPSLTVKAGRQFLVYDDERIFSTRNWGQAATTYDALLFKYLNKENKWDIDLGGSWNNDVEQIYQDAYYPSGKIKMISFAHFHKSLSESLNLSLIATATGYTKNDTSRILYARGTYGANLEYKKNNLKIRATGYFQNGKNKAGREVQAYCTSVVGSYTIKKVTLGAGMDYISGQSTTKTDNDYQATDHLFDLFYGMRHSYYGLMDMFTNIPKSTANGGLMDLYFNTRFKLTEKHNLQLDYHYFSLAQDVAIKSGDQTIHPDHGLGSEVDMLYRYNVNEFLTCDLGYSFMLPTETMEMISTPGKTVEFSHWVYFMITLKPTLLKL
jgi:hypothetical protein